MSVAREWRNSAAYKKRFPEPPLANNLATADPNSNHNENLLHKDWILNNPNRIRYFHIPLNNMSVSAAMMVAVDD